MHAQDKDTFDALVDSIKSKWATLEKPYTPATSQVTQFHQWFVANIMPHMRKAILTDTRQRNGIDTLGVPNFAKFANLAIFAKLVGEKQRITLKTFKGKVIREN